jgi:hypothetical protein
MMMLLLRFNSRHLLDVRVIPFIPLLYEDDVIEQTERSNNKEQR